MNFLRLKALAARSELGFLHKCRSWEVGPVSLPAPRATRGPLGTSFLKTEGLDALPSTSESEFSNCSNSYERTDLSQIML
jgi:hypothetical protein